MLLKSIFKGELGLKTQNPKLDFGMTIIKMNFSIIFVWWERGGIRIPPLLQHEFKKRVSFNAISVTRIKLKFIFRTLILNWTLNPRHPRKEKQTLININHI